MDEKPVTPEEEFQAIKDFFKNIPTHVKFTNPGMPELQKRIGTYLYGKGPKTIKELGVLKTDLLRAVSYYGEMLLKHKNSIYELDIQKIEQALAIFSNYLKVVDAYIERYDRGTLRPSKRIETDSEDKIKDTWGYFHNEDLIKGFKEAMISAGKFSCFNLLIDEPQATLATLAIIDILEEKGYFKKRIVEAHKGWFLTTFGVTYAKDPRRNIQHDRYRDLKKLPDYNKLIEKYKVIIPDLPK